MQSWSRVAALLLLVVLMLFTFGSVYAPQPVEPEPAQEPLPPESPREAAPPVQADPRRFTLVVTGDLMAHEDQLIDAYDAQTGLYDFSHCFAQVTADLQDGDYTIGNLETVFGGAEIGYSSYPQFNTPDSYAAALFESGFDFLTTANNHCLDKYEAGLLRTLEVIDRLGFAHTGTYASREERDVITIREVAGARVAFLAYTFSTNGIPIPEGREYLVNGMEEELILRDLENAKALEPDLIVVLPHNGTEYETAPNDVYIWWMDFFIRNGADVVLASHPHVLQRMEVRQVPEGDGFRDAFIIYSLGNFISSQRWEGTDCSIILKLDFVQEGDAPPVLERVRFVPTWVQYQDTSGGFLVRVLPILDAIKDYEENGNTNGLLPQNLNRLYRAHDSITRLFLGEVPAREDMQREYVYYARGDIPEGCDE